MGLIVCNWVYSRVHWQYSIFLRYWLQCARASISLNIMWLLVMADSIDIKSWEIIQFTLSWKLDLTLYVFDHFDGIYTKISLHAFMEIQSGLAIKLNREVICSLTLLLNINVFSLDYWQFLCEKMWQHQGINSLPHLTTQPNTQTLYRK